MEPTLTDEETKLIEDKSKEIAASLKVSEVHPIVLINPDTFERIIGYIKEPDYLVKLKILDKCLMSGFYSAADDLRDLCIVKEESNPLMYGTGPECDKYKLGATEFCITLVRRSQNQFKKK